MNEPNANAPLGQPIAVFLEGILDGRVADGAALSVRVRELGTAGAGAFRCDVRGGRFSLLPNETQLAEPDFDEAKQARFLDALQLFTRLVNIGDAKSLACHPASTTHRQLNPAELAKAGVKEDMVRLSVGIEHIDDLLEDLEQALAAV